MIKMQFWVMGDNGEEVKLKQAEGAPAKDAAVENSTEKITVGKRKKSGGEAAAGKNVKKQKKKADDKTPTLIPALDDLFDEPEEEAGSVQNAEEAFKWLVGPTDVDKFYKVWKEK